MKPTLLGPILAIATKDLRILFRDKMSAFFTLGFPLFIAILFGSIFGGSGDGGGSPITIAVVDESGGKLAKGFIKDLDGDEMLEALVVKDRTEGETSVRTSKAFACVILPKDFESSMDTMFTPGKGAELEVIVDPSRRSERGLLVGKLNELVFRQMGHVFNDPARMTSMLDTARLSIRESTGLSAEDRDLFSRFFDNTEKLSKGMAEPKATDGSDAKSGGGLGGFQPAKITVTELKSKRADGPSSAFEFSFPQGIAWGLMSCVIAFGAGMAHERAGGTLLRLAVAPISRAQLLLGKALGCFLACLIVICVMMFFGVLVFRVHVTSWPLFVLAALICSLGFSGVMMLIAGVFRTEGGAEGAGRAVIMILTMIGGGTIPLFVMPQWLRTASSISPAKWAIMATEGALWRGLTFSEMLLPLGALCIFALIGFSIGAWAFSRAEAR